MKIKKHFIITDESQLWFMSDLHYGHKNIIAINNRPFNDLEEMNLSIEKELVDKVKPRDILFDLGDLFFSTSEKKILQVLGSIKAAEFHKLVGNHDRLKIYQKVNIRPFFTTLSDILEIIVEYRDKPYSLVLSHYPMLSWNGKARGSWMIAGHTHGNIDTFNDASNDLRVDIGYDGNLAKESGSFLLKFDDILGYMTNKRGDSNTFREHALGKCKFL